MPSHHEVKIKKQLRNINTGALMKVRVIIRPDEEGVYVATCPNLPGCVSQGKTREDALENIKDAIEGYLASLKKHNEPIPPSIEEEIVEVHA